MPLLCVRLAKALTTQKRLEGIKRASCLFLTALSVQVSVTKTTFRRGSRGGQGVRTPLTNHNNMLMFNL